MQKILLIHGWNYTNYNSSKCIDAWQNRKGFVDELQKYFEVLKVNLPGFCGTSDPFKPWSLDDYVSYVDQIIKIQKPDIVLGYSFGGAIALKWKHDSCDKDIKVVLVSPAIIRNYQTKKISKIGKYIKRILPQSITSWLRDIYLTRFNSNPYYIHASKIMRETYRNIVTVDLRKELLDLSEPITLIYGGKDTATPPFLVKEVITKTPVKHNIEIISDGGHDIANSHTSKLVESIRHFLI